MEKCYPETMQVGEGWAHLSPWRRVAVLGTRDRHSKVPASGEDKTEESQSLVVVSPLHLPLQRRKVRSGKKQASGVSEACCGRMALLF